MKNYMNDSKALSTPTLKKIERKVLLSHKIAEKDNERVISASRLKYESKGGFKKLTCC